MKRRLLMLAMVGLFLAVPLVSHAARKPARSKVQLALRNLGISSAKILGIEPSPVKGLYFVYVDLGARGRQGFIITKDAKYIIAGRIFNVATSSDGTDLVMKTGVEKGYYPLPAGTPLSVKISTTGSPSFGPPNAPMVIIYYDPFCPFSLKELRMLKDMADRGKIHLVLKYFVFNGPGARALARDQVCLYQQGRKREFWAMVFSKGAVARQLRFRCDKNQADLIELLLNRDGEEAKRMRLRGTPALVVGGRVYTGEMNKVMLEKLLLTEGKGSG